MRTRKINVTQIDIKRGDIETAESCPVARAIARAFHKKVGYACVRSTAIELPSKCVAAPNSVENFVSNFDKGNPVNPFSFTLRY